MGLNQGIYSQKYGGASTCYSLTFDESGYLTNGNPLFKTCKTIFVRFKLETATSSGGATEGLLLQYTGGSSTTNRGFLLYIIGSSGKLRCYIDGGAVDIYSNGTFNADQWYCACVVIDATGTKMYIDGVQQTQTGTKTTAIAYSGVWGIGGNYSVFGASNWFNGDISKVVTYTTSRTLAEVIAEETTNPTSSTVGLKNAWLFPEGSGVTTTGEKGVVLTAYSTFPAWGTTPCI